MNDKGDAFSYKASPLEKQSTGLFFNSPLAMRLRIISLFFKSCEQRPEALPLDSAKGTQSLWNPFHTFNHFFQKG